MLKFFKWTLRPFRAIHRELWWYNHKRKERARRRALGLE